MKSSHRTRFSTTTVAWRFHNDHSATNPKTEITVEPPMTTVQQIPTQNESRQYSAAVKIQSAQKGHMVRAFVRKISVVNSEANRWQRIIQRQDTVDAVRTNERERIKINEALMRLLFQLDSVPGLDPNVRELRRHVSRKIVGLQEILDAVSDAKIEHWDGFLRDWDDVLVGFEKQVCRDKGCGCEMERFCAEHLGFQCLQRFLRDL